MTIQHKNIPDGERHEPKGVSTATANQVYVANGSASGAWIDMAFDINVQLANVSTSSFVLVPINVNCTVTQIKYVLAGAITVADDTITVTRGSDGATMGTQVIAQSGSAEGTTFVQTISANNVLTASTHRYIKIATGGGSTGAVPLAITIRCLRNP